MAQTCNIASTLLLVVAAVATTRATTTRYDFESDLNGWTALRSSWRWSDRDSLSSVLPPAQHDGFAVLDQAQASDELLSPQFSMPEGGSLTMNFYLRSKFLGSNTLRISYVANDETFLLLNLEEYSLPNNTDWVSVSTDIPPTEDPLSLEVFCFNGHASGPGEPILGCVLDQIVVHVNGEYTVEPTTPETEAPTEATTEPETEAPTEATTEPETEAPTEATTEPETEAPTEATTEPETEAPTEATTEPETEAPTEATTEPETEAPTEATTEPETEAPTEATTEPETEAPTEATTEPETEAPTEATTEPETEAPTEATTEPETEAPTEATTEPETEAPTEATTEPETEATTEPETEAPTEATTEPETEAPTEATTEPETEAPTEATTEPETEAPTEATTEPETEATTEPETEAPTEATTEPETEAPTEATTEPETEAPTEATTEPETEAPTEATTEPETEAPTEATTEPETEAPTEATTEPETEAPTEATTEPETEAPTEATTEPETEVPTEATTEPETEAPTEATTEPETEVPTEATTEPETEAPTEATTEPETEPIESTTEIPDGPLHYTFNADTAGWTLSHMNGATWTRKEFDSNGRPVTDPPHGPWVLQIRADEVLAGTVVAQSPLLEAVDTKMGITISFWMDGAEDFQTELKVRRKTDFSTFDVNPIMNLDPFGDQENHRWITYRASLDGLTPGQSFSIILEGSLGGHPNNSVAVDMVSFEGVREAALDHSSFFDFETGLQGWSAGNLEGGRWLLQKWSELDPSLAVPRPLDGENFLFVERFDIHSGVITMESPLLTLSPGTMQELRLKFWTRGSVVYPATLRIRKKSPDGKYDDLPFLNLREYGDTDTGHWVTYFLTYPIPADIEEVSYQLVLEADLGSDLDNLVALDDLIMTTSPWPREGGR